MIFKKKNGLQGNHIFKNGTKAIFNSEGLYKTDDEAEIAELKAEKQLFEELSEAIEVKAAPVNHEKLAKAITGLQTSDKK
jgi:hypothetical protein